MNPRKIDPDVARLRAALAIATRHHPDDDHSRLRSDLAACTWLSRAERLVEQAPPLNDAQRARLAARVVPVLVGEYDAA